MAQVFPFRAYRFNPSLAPFDRVLTQPYDKISPERQAEYYAMHPQNLIAVEKGHVFPDDSPQNNVYTRAAAAIKGWIAANAVRQDPAAAGGRNPGTATSAQYFAAARTTSSAFTSGRPWSVHLALSSLSSHS